MHSLHDLNKLKDNLPSRSVKMPLLFIGHGSPMNGIELNEFSGAWENLGIQLPIPEAVLCISAHWYTQGTFITAMEKPKTIHDFGGFPKALFDVQYPAPGNPPLAQEAASLVHKTSITLDHEWGLDHGTWTIVRRMYPQANIPVLQLSIDYTKPPQYHYELAQELEALREKGVLIIGSGNIIHNLRLLNWQSPQSVFDWAVELNDKFKTLIINHEHEPLIDYHKLGPAAKLSIPTPEHYLPLLYTLGLKHKNEQVKFFNDKLVMGSISMTSLLIE